MPKTVLGIDLGASGGRCILGRFDGNRLELETIHQFPNGGVEVEGQLIWDERKIWNEILAGMTKIAAGGIQVDSIGVDSWGVDFALLDKQDHLLHSPLHYRNPITRGILGRAFEVMSREELFAVTGLQFMEINSLFQLHAMQLAHFPPLAQARPLLLIPDYFHWLLCGEKSNEKTNLSTTQLLDATTQTISEEIIQRFNLPNLFGNICEAGANLGTLKEAIAAQTGLNRAPVVVPATHDTGSAVLAVPANSFAAEQPEWCFISSGTWSLMGVETARPKLTADVLAANFTNEAGVGGTTRLLKNIAGLWLLQQCRESWRKSGHDYNWESLIQMACDSKPFACVIDADHAGFVAPADMPTAIDDFCRRTGQQPPSHIGEYARVCLEALAIKYRMVMHELQNILGSRLSVLHIVGGGSQNRLLCQMAADACQLPVLAGPVEATAIGNMMSQWHLDPDIQSYTAARELVRASFSTDEYEPTATDAWAEACEQLQQRVLN